MELGNLQDIRHLKLFPKRYKTTKGLSADEWREVWHRYNNFKKIVDCSDYHWYVITYKDGRKELAYLKVWRLVEPHGGRLCRGMILPMLFSPTQYEHVEDIRIAF